MTENKECSKCLGEYLDCKRCGGTGMLLSAGDITDRCGNHPAAIRAREILDVKTAVKEIELYSKLLLAGKFHASFNVVGTLSSRMSGGDGLNAQGIKKTKDVRRMFPLAWEGYELSGGDFDSFEVTLADSVYDDKTLRADLLSGKKIHALFTMALFPGKTYEEIIASDGTSFDMYAKGKTAVFRMIYGGGWEGMADGPEWHIQRNLKQLLSDRGWLVEQTHGNLYQQGLPDLFVAHPRYGQRWIDCKQPKRYTFTKAQRIKWPLWERHGVGIWIITAATQEEYDKLMGPPNWRNYWKPAASGSDLRAADYASSTSDQANPTARNCQPGLRAWGEIPDIDALLDELAKSDIE